ncbi:AraC-like ligand-binding domain-containing protein [Halostreptopolyspora alba]|uniref:Helix-turn-helix domain-containing protein n=1 Tax=Halostreptopolyspora alba TaxID=2487137 RepID=A0A3N0EBS0_9ACTN|nr:helix-turn-helix domain-containing protein [Nocardiopsaceae bacterium YIM 96095]
MLTTVETHPPHQVHSFIAHDFPEWRARMSDRFVRLRLSTRRPANFHGRLVGRNFDGISVARVRAREHEVARLPELISPEERHFVKFTLQLRGSSTVTQEGRAAVLAPGDMAVYETSRPYRLVCGDDSEILVVVFPAESLALPVGALATVTAVRIAPTRGVGSVVRSLFQQLGASVRALPESTGSRLVYQAVDLLDTLLRTELERHRDQGRGAPPEILARVKEYIGSHLGDPDLGPASIARSHFISVRYLHHLFESEGATVSSYIKRQRLELCRRDLVDAAYRDETVTTIAARWGFVESAHFSRAFKQRFGVPPSAYRTRHAA